MLREIWFEEWNFCEYCSSFHLGPILNFVLEMAGDSREYNGWDGILNQEWDLYLFSICFSLPSAPWSFASDTIWVGGRSSPIMSFIFKKKSENVWDWGSTFETKCLLSHAPLVCEDRPLWTQEVGCCAAALSLKFLWWHRLHGDLSHTSALLSTWDSLSWPIPEDRCLLHCSNLEWEIAVVPAVVPAVMVCS